MSLIAKCPTIGRGFIWFAPKGFKPVKNDAASVKVAYDKYNQMQID